MSRRDEDNTFLAGLSVGMAIILLLSLILFVGDSSDEINTQKMGERMCESKGYVYSYREFDGSDKVPIIHCKRNSTQPLIDGIVFFDK